MIFAAMIDAGLLPFLAFSAYMAYNEHYTGIYGWDTLFGVPLTTWYIVYTTFLLCVIQGGLLVLSLMLGIYLAILFRKIAKLPPDMNPLEPNLTSRPHKRNKSEMTASDKHMSQASLVPNKRISSTADPLIAPDRRIPFMHTRTDSADHFPHLQSNSAQGSHTDLSRPKRLYQQPNNSIRASYVPINKSIPGPPSLSQSVMTPSISSRQPGTDLGHQTARSSQLAQDDMVWQGATHNSHVSPPQTYHQRVTAPLYSQAQTLKDENVRPVSPISSGPSTPDSDRNDDYMEIKNWYESPHSKNKRIPDYGPIRQQQYSPTPTQQERENRRVSLYDFDRDLHSPSPPMPDIEEKNSTEGPRNPLGMNPPSPMVPEDLQQQQQPLQQTNSGNATNHEPKRYVLYDAPVNLPPPSQRPKVATRPSSFVGSGSKGRYYGSLRSAVGSLNGKVESEKENDGKGNGGMWMVPPGGSDTASNYSKEPSERSDTMDSTLGWENHTSEMYRGERNHDTGGARVGAPPLEDVRKFSFLDEPEIDVEMKNGHGFVVREDENEYESDRQGRVVSITGNDLSGTYAGLGAEFGRGMGRRREVSGKVAEEGRGNSFAGRTGFADDSPARSGEAKTVTTSNWSGNANRTGKVNANRNAAGQGLAAAGWARFKGL